MLDKKCFEEKRRREEKEAEKLEMCQDIWALALSISTSSQLHLSPSFRNDKTSILEELSSP
jgi:hypothetical protein